MKTEITAIAIALLMLTAIFTPAVSAVQMEKPEKFKEYFTERLFDALEKSPDFTSFDLAEDGFISRNHDIAKLKFRLHDQDPLPLTIDVLFDQNKRPNKLAFFSHGSGLNFDANFFTPENSNIARYVVENLKEGNIVIGITAREDLAPPDYNFGNGYGLREHVSDLDKVIKLFNFTDRDYELVGHSAGGMTVLFEGINLGDNDHMLKGLHIIDMQGGYAPGSQERANAMATYFADQKLISMSITADTSVTAVKYLVYQAKTDPLGDSGMPRGAFPGNFTNYNLLGFALIHTGDLPGATTEITGLPGSWYLKSNLAGTYNFADDPRQDSFTLTHTKLETVYEAVNKIGSGLFPMQFDADINKVWSGLYQASWDRIEVPVTWINTEYGFGDCSYSVSLLVNSPKATCEIAQDYGHGDPVYSKTAKQDFWPKLFKIGN